MSFPNKFFNRGNPLRDLLAESGQYEILNTAKVVTVTNESALEFGNIGSDTQVQIGLEYAATEGEQFAIAVGLRYTGDAGAFTYSAGDGTGAFATPVPLVDGDTYWTIILPDSTAAAPYNLSITALYADENTELTGTIEIIDRFDFPAGGLEPLRVLKTIALSKTAVAA